MRDAYLNNDTNIRAMLVRLFTSAEFLADSAEFARYAWPAEFVVRAIKETGWNGFSADRASPRSPTWASSCTSRPT